MVVEAPVSAAELPAIACDDGRCELIDGSIVRRPFLGWRAGSVASNIFHLLNKHARVQHAGAALPGGTGFWIGRDPDTVLSSTVSFIDEAAWEARKRGACGYFVGGPGLAVEVLSPGDHTAAVDKKIQTWLAAGAKLVWIVDPELETVTIYRSPTDVSIVSRDGRIEGRNSIAGFECDVCEFFEE